MQTPMSNSINELNGLLQGELAACETYGQATKNMHNNKMHKVDFESKRLIESELLPSQEKTHNSLSTLKKTLELREL